MKRPAILHPFFFALFPVLFLFSVNQDSFDLSTMVAPGLKVLGLVLGATAILALLTGSIRKAGLVVSLFVVLFTSFRHVVLSVSWLNVSVLGVARGPERILLGVFVFLFAAGTLAVVRSRGNLVNLTKILNVVSAFLVLFAGGRIGHFHYATRHVRKYARINEPIVLKKLTGEEAASLPNIYYIILDGYGRSDRLLETYGRDNGKFLSALESRGFYVAGKARTNYSHTVLSLASSLNMEYLDDLVALIGDETNEQRPLRILIERSNARRFLAERGYRFVALKSGYWATDISHADLYLAASGESEFEKGLIATTAAASPRRQRAQDRRTLKYIFEQLPETAALPGPLFVFAHVLAPHPPFAVDADGNDPGGGRYFQQLSANHLIAPGKLTRTEYIQRYLAQMEWVEKVLPEALDGIIAASRVDPIIIVQGDHGPGCYLHHDELEKTYLADRMSILNAYRLPAGGREKLWESIHPVNTFRVIFNHYFDAGFKRLEERSYYARAKHIYRLAEVTGMIGDEADRGRFDVLRGMDYYPEGSATEEAPTVR